MIWSRDDGKREGRGYHHGNLKEALIRAALELIAKNGAAGFTFADAARSAGVSPAAPYRHFRDRNELMADVALRGFDLLGRALEAALKDDSPDPTAKLENVGRAYLEFARRQPAFYSAMFEAGTPVGSNPELRQASEQVFGVLRTASEKVISTLPAKTRPPALMMGLHIWALLHGVASLFGRGDAAGRSVPMSVEELFEAGVLIYLDGLKRGPSKARSGSE